MTDKQTQSMAEQSNMEKDPADWVTGDEPMTVYGLVAEEMQVAPGHA